MSPGEPVALRELEPGAASPAPLPLPWEGGEESSLSALFGTIREFLAHPGLAFRAMNRAGWGEPLGFGLITGTFGLLAASYTQLLLSLGLTERLSSIPGWSNFALLGSQGVVGLMLLTPVIVLLSLLLGGLCLLAVLKLWRCPASFAVALRITCYAQTGLVLAVIPLVGALVGVFWSFYLKIRGVKEVFDLSRFQATLAVFLAFALESLFLMVALVALVMVMIFGRLS